MIDSGQLLVLHSYFRWAVLVIMVIQFAWIWINYKRNKEFTTVDFKLLLFFTIVFNIQLLLGWSLYFNSMVVDAFWHDVAKGVKNRQMHFFGLEHMSMMTLAIILINYNTYRAYKNINTTIVFHKLWKAYIVILLIILSSIPWSFSPLTSRPNWR